MSVIKAGTEVKILSKAGKPFHQFEEGAIAISTGQEFGTSNWGNWSGFSLKSPEADITFQWLLPEHYEVVLGEALETTEAFEEVLTTSQEVVDTTLPTKAVYAVLQADGDILATTSDRDYARELKSALGGKRKGVLIYQYSATKEIR